MSTVVTGLKPTGQLTLGNYLGAVRPLCELAESGEHEVTCFVADLHALTIPHDPAALRERTEELAATLLAAGLPSSARLFVQSTLSAHSELAYLLSTVASFGEMGRMVQFKEKSAGSSSVALALFTYPVLMAADILCHDASLVPVGADQRQHLELTRDLAERFNARYGATFVVPDALVPSGAARLRDLRDPSAKMGKTGADPGGILYLADPPEVLEKKIRRAVTDDDPALSYDPATRPGVANLATILAVLSDTTPERALAGLHGAAALKTAVADAVIETLVPIQQRQGEVLDDARGLHERLDDAAVALAPRTEAVVARARAALGLA